MFFFILTGIISLIVILLSCEFFTNAIEWTGKKLNLNEGVTGSILAAVGTALPETIIPIIAILFVGGKHGVEIGIGAILGAPFMLSTLAFGIVGISIFLYHFKNGRSFTLDINDKILSNDMIFFIIVYILAILFSFLPHYYKKIFSFVFILMYIFYIYLTFSHEREDKEEEIEKLYFYKRDNPPFKIVILQDILSLLGIIIGARFFVNSIEHISTAMNWSPFIFSLFIAPIATELPEKFNSVIWIGKRKDTLALGNISGAMVFQSSIVVFVGVVGTEWILTTQAKLSAIIALVSSFIFVFYMKIFKKLNGFILLSGIIFYILYIILILKFVK